MSCDMISVLQNTPTDVKLYYIGMLPPITFHKTYAAYNKWILLIFRVMQQ